jgi:hypothetical protein
VRCIIPAPAAESMSIGLFGGTIFQTGGKLGFDPLELVQPKGGYRRVVAVYTYKGRLADGVQRDNDAVKPGARPNAVANCEPNMPYCVCI